MSAQCSRKPLFFPVPVLTNFWPLLSVFFVKTQRIRNKPSIFTNFLLYRVGNKFSDTLNVPFVSNWFMSVKIAVNCKS